MEFKVNEIKAGLMIFVSFAILILFLVLIFGVNFGENTKEYQTYLQYIGGITKGSLVKYGGMDVGYVTEITLPKSDKTGIGVKIKIDEKTPVKVNSKAYVTSVGIMADPHIEITAGSPDAEFLPDGEVLDSKEVPSFSQMAEPLGELNARLQGLLSRVTQIFNDENQSHFTSMLENMDKLMGDGHVQLLNMMENLEELSGQLADLSKEINHLMDKNEGNIEDTLAHLEKTVKETGEFISDLRKTLAEFQTIMSANSSDIIQIMENFQFASQNLEEFTRMVKERPWLLVRKAAPPERKIQ
ncbi:MAG: MlaD family protein [bacterium]